MFGVFFVLSLGLMAGFGRRLPWGLLPFGAGHWLWALAAVGLVVLLFSPRWQQKADRLSVRIMSHRTWVLFLLALAGVYEVLNFILFRQFGYRFPFLHLALLGLGALVIKPGNLRYSFALNLALLVSSIVTFPLHIVRSDMLPVIQHALDLLAAGGNPYAPFVVDSVRDQMSYLPGTFLAHLPAWWAGLDLRWNEVLYRALWMFLLLRRCRSYPAGHPWALAVQALTLNPYLIFRHDLYFDFFLLLLVAYWCFPRWRMILLPVAAFTRQWIWVAVPFLVVSEMRRIGAGRALVRFVSSSLVLVVGAGAGAYFATRGLLDWRSLAGGVFSITKMMDLGGYYGDYGFTFAPLLYQAGLKAGLPVLQALVAVGLFCRFLFSGRRGGDVGRCVVVAWSLCLMLNFHFWAYFWLSPMLWCLTTMDHAQECPSSS